MSASLTAEATYWFILTNLSELCDSPVLEKNINIVSSNGADDTETLIQQYLTYSARVDG